MVSLYSPAWFSFSTREMNAVVRCKGWADNEPVLDRDLAGLL